MKLISTTVLATAFLLLPFSNSFGQERAKALTFKMKANNGKDISLAKYAGKVVVFVNVASDCGYTPQYKQLQALHKKYSKKGLAIVGVPCNQFGNCLLYTSPSPRDATLSRMPSSA